MADELTSGDKLDVQPLGLDTVQKYLLSGRDYRANQERVGSRWIVGKF